jgi:hypothetical protein
MGGTKDLGLRNEATPPQAGWRCPSPRNETPCKDLQLGFPPLNMASFEKAGGEEKGRCRFDPSLLLPSSTLFVVSLPFIRADSNLGSHIDQIGPIPRGQLAAFHQTLDLLAKGLQ